MKIAFDISLEDLVHFQLYHLRHSAAVRTLRRRTVLAMAPLTGAMTAATAYWLILPSGVLWPLLPAFFAGGFGYYATDVLWARFVTPWSVRHHVADGQNKSVLGWHEIEISEAGVIERTRESESRQSWASIERVVQDEKYIFIFTQANAAHVIPKAAFQSGDAQRYVDTAVAYRDRAGATVA